MKRCVQCSRIFADGDAFCIDDGAMLETVMDASQNRVVISLEDKPPTSEIPTQVVLLPSIPVNDLGGTSKFLYMIIGGLLAVILTGAGFFALQNTGEKNLAQVSVQTEKSPSVSPTANQNTATQTPVYTEKKDERAIPKPETSSNAVFTGNTYSTNMNRAPDGFRLTRNFNRTFSGTADNDGISMRLQRSGSSLSGRVFSRKSATEITVSGNIYDDGSFQMSEYSDIGVMTGIYQGRIYSDGTMSGTWTKPDGSKSRPFYMRSN